jgi:hypothetical protein
MEDKMLNTFKVYQSQYIVGIGMPIIVITGFSTVTNELHSEYFVFLRDNEEFFARMRFHFRYNYPAPHPIEIDGDFMMATALSDSEMALYRHVNNEYIKRNAYNFPTLEYKESSEKLLFQLHLVNECSKQIQQIMDETECPKLKIFLKDISEFPRLRN